MKAINVLADRMLGLVAPRVTAAAASRTSYCYFTDCYCVGSVMWQEYCCFTNGRHECSPCQNYLAKCPS